MAVFQVVVQIIVVWFVRAELPHLTVYSIWTRRPFSYSGYCGEVCLGCDLNGCIPSSSTNYSSMVCQSGTSSSNGILNMDTPTLLLFGILWGSLFGLRSEWLYSK